MPTTVITWDWDEAFDKFGFSDGDGPNFTHEVADFIRSLGYDVECDTWGMHNFVIKYIQKDGVIIETDGYACPTSYLSADLVSALVAAFGPASGLMEESVK